MPGWNWPQFDGGAGIVFEVEGTLREHDWFDGAWWDRRLLAFHRERWAEVKRAVLDPAFANIDRDDWAR